MQDFQLLSYLFSGAGGALVGVTGTLVGVRLQNRAADRRRRNDIAMHFYSQAERVGIQAMRDGRRGDELDLPIEPGWDLQLIGMVREIGLRHSAETANAADNVVEALTEIVATRTVGSVLRLDSALSEFAKSLRG